jgi:hypothetical protein
MAIDYAEFEGRASALAYLVANQSDHAGVTEALCGFAEVAVQAERRRIVELEGILRCQGAMLHEIAEAAGFTIGDAYSAPAIIARLRR